MVRSLRGSHGGYDNNDSADGDDSPVVRLAWTPVAPRPSRNKGLWMAPSRFKVINRVFPFVFHGKVMNDASNVVVAVAVRNKSMYGVFVL